MAHYPVSDSAAPFFAVEGPRRVEAMVPNNNKSLNKWYMYLSLGSYRLPIKERNGGVGIRGNNRVVDESTPCVANVNCEGFYDGETELL